MESAVKSGVRAAAEVILGEEGLEEELERAAKEGGGKRDLEDREGGNKLAEKVERRRREEVADPEGRFVSELFSW